MRPVAGPGVADLRLDAAQGCPLRRTPAAALFIDRMSASASPALPTSGATVFQARGLTKVYGEGDAAVHALKGVDLDCRTGEFVVVLGASGSGKSTLLNLLGGLDVPSSGSLLYRGWDLAHADEAGLTRFRRDAVGFVFQFYNLIPSLTARENEIGRAHV